MFQQQQPYHQQQPPPQQHQQPPQQPPFMPMGQPSTGGRMPMNNTTGNMANTNMGMPPQAQAQSQAQSQGFPPHMHMHHTAPPQQQPPQQTLNDPTNDVKSWSEHVNEADKRVYWHNKITKKSTYEKPECLKCPEERSIPACRWKEYAKDGKKYYSDGTESR
jgi:hypothetical protein